jgi:hypothetical protein
MRRLLFVGALGAVMGLAAAAVSVAQDQPAASGAPAASSAPAASGPSVDSTISDLLANPTTKAVLAKDLPALLTYDGLDQIKGMSIRQISQFPQANIDAAKLAQIQTDLQASGSAPAAAPAASSAPAAASSAPAAPH